MNRCYFLARLRKCVGFVAEKNYSPKRYRKCGRREKDIWKKEMRRLAEVPRPLKRKISQNLISSVQTTRILLLVFTAKLERKRESAIKLNDASMQYAHINKYYNNERSPRMTFVIKILILFISRDRREPFQVDVSLEAG